MFNLKVSVSMILLDNMLSLLIIIFKKIKN